MKNIFCRQSNMIKMNECFKLYLPSCISKWNLNQSSTNFIILFEILGHNLKLKINCIVQKGLCSWNEIFSTDFVEFGLKNGKLHTYYSLSQSHKKLFLSDLPLHQMLTKFIMPWNSFSEGQPFLYQIQRMNYCFWIMQSNVNCYWTIIIEIHFHPLRSKWWLLS